MRPLPKNVEAVTAAINEIGTAFLVGGCVRDHFLNVTPKDYDVLACDVSLNTLIEAMKAIPGVRYAEFVGESFGVLKVPFEDGEVVDVALPRRYTPGVERENENDYDPSLPVEEDLARRDFTMNAMAFDTRMNVFIDPFDGRADIERCFIRAVGNAEDRFTEDKLRMLRAFRFQSRLGFFITADTRRAMDKEALARVSPDRIVKEFYEILMGRYAFQTLTEMSEHGFLSAIIPEWEESIGFEQHNSYHYATVDVHVLDAFNYVVEHNGSLRARVAVLLHDIAKPRTYSEHEGVGHFYGHEHEGEKLSAVIMRRMRLPEEMVKGVSTIIREHLRPPKEPSDKALRKYMADLGSLWEDALMVKAGDVSAHVLPVDFDVTAWHEDWKVRLASVPPFLSGFDQKKLALSGLEIVKEFNAKGTEVGTFKKHAAAAVVEGRVANDSETLLNFLRAERAAGCI